MTTLTPTRIASGFQFPESPRWWDDKLYFCDVQGQAVYSVEADGTGTNKVARFDGLPSGLGQLPDGTRIVGEQTSRKIWRMSPTGIASQLFADLSDVSRHWTNDIVTSRDGFTYVGCIGHDLRAGEDPAPGSLVVLDPDGVIIEVADLGLMMPNGLAITPDGATLLVAQTFGEEITALDRHADGRVNNPRTWASLPGTNPDGICLDAEGGVWVGSCFTHEFLRVIEGGTVTHRIPTPGRWALAPLLGGPHRTTLFLLTTETDFERMKVGDIEGYVEAIEVDVPGAGVP